MDLLSEIQLGLTPASDAANRLRTHASGAGGGRA